MKCNIGKKSAIIKPQMLQPCHAGIGAPSSEGKEERGMLFERY
jgi:hypothetical protein